MWSCRRCTLFNGPESAECDICKLSRSAVTKMPDWWQCNHCCQFNALTLMECAVCDRPQTALAVSAIGTQQAEQSRECAGTEAQRSGPRHSREQTDREVNSEDTGETETVWVCQALHNSNVCGSHNSLDTYRCHQCDNIKPYLPSQLSLSQVPKSLLSSSSSGDGGDWERQTEAEEEGELRQRQGEREASWRIQEEASWLPCTPDEPRSMQSPSDGVEAAAASVQHLGLNSGPADDEEELQFPDSECRMVLVGKTGNGKSATANTILGLDQHFDSSFQFGSLTKKCQRHNTIRFGVRLEVVDTPGLFDTHMDQDAIITEVIKCLGIVSPGPHAVLLVVRIGVRFTNEENRAVEEVHKMFGVHLLRFLVIIFTHGDELNDLTDAEKEAKIRDLLDNSPDPLKELMNKANHRYVVFNNKGTADVKRQQVKQLLTTISRLYKVNGRRPFTSDLLQLVERCMSDREKELEKQFGGKRHRRHMGSDRERHIFYRDMAREEVVQEKTLLDQLKKIVLPTLKTLLEILFKAIISIIVNKGMAVPACVLQ